MNTLNTLKPERKPSFLARMKANRARWQELRAEFLFTAGAALLVGGIGYHFGTSTAAMVTGAMLMIVGYLLTN